MIFLADLTQDAPTVFNLKQLGIEITNSMVYTWVIAIVILLVLRLSTKKMQEIPSGAQNAVEAVVEGIQNFLSTILDPKVVKWSMPIIASFFIFILTANLMGLLPGVGSILVKSHDHREIADVQAEEGALDIHITPGLLHEEKRLEKKESGFFEKLPLYVSSSNQNYVPLFRPPTADANMTIAMAFVFFVMNLYWAIRFNGVWGFFVHMFGPKGGMKGFLLVMLVPIFAAVGILEVISILIRPVALSMRLYGNIYGGESVLTIMLGMLPFGLAAIPFYFLEVIVATVQALVFTILCVAFTATMCTHIDDGSHGNDHDHDDEGEKGRAGGH
ncbi:MAG: F0F1 ATP synthase subunit A [Verrucomicrobiota bacterium]|nr:F0F1 ATP synthase subunit A [Verrucomicrobiota bacterium]